jgi:DNA replication and repair protein RecF
VELTAEPDAPRAVRIDGKTAPQTALARLIRIVWLVPAQDRLWIEGADGRRRFLDRMAMSFLPDHAEDVLTYEKAMRERNRLLRDEVRDPAWYGALERQMAEAGAAIATNRASALARLATAQEGAETAFPAAALTLEGEAPGRRTRPTSPRPADNRPRDMAAGRTLLGPHRADLGAVYVDKDAPARQCSTGEQKALLISLVLANARASEGRDRRRPPHSAG